VFAALALVLLLVALAFAGLPARATQVSGAGDGVATAELGGPPFSAPDHADHIHLGF
jgi:hypothetical protein